MKKIISIIILLSICIVTLCGCGGSTTEVTDTTKHVVKDTPNQVGKKQMQGSVKGFDFDKSYEEADIVAEVTIREWLSEINDEFISETTIFRASLDKTFKNKADNNLKEINLSQAGNSNYTIVDNPLFKNGDRLLLYLKKVEGKEGVLHVEDNTYYILGEHTGVFRIININGRDCFVKQVGDCPQLSDVKITEDSGKIRNTLAKSYSVEFSNLDKNGLPKAYNLEEVEKLIEKQKNK